MHDCFAIELTGECLKCFIRLTRDVPAVVVQSEALWARIPEIIQVRIPSRAMGTFFPHAVSSIFRLSLTHTLSLSLSLSLSLCVRTHAHTFSIFSQFFFPSFFFQVWWSLIVAKYAWVMLIVFVGEFCSSLPEKNFKLFRHNRIVQKLLMMVCYQRG